MAKAQEQSKIAIGYVRVSTEDQASEGVSLAAQREKIRAYCDLHGLKLLGLEADEGLSGKRADNRPGLQEALKRTCQQRGVLVVYALSRLARSTRDCINIAERIENCGADLASITEKIDTTSSMGRFFFRLMASLGELERDQISERTTAAMAHLRRSGRRISRHVPFGFQLAKDRRTLRDDPREQKTLRLIQLRRDKGCSYHKIAAELNAHQVSPKFGEHWHASSVRSICLSIASRQTRTTAC